MDEKTKTKFSDVFGALVAGVAYGRGVADMEALRIAYFYQQDELLKGLPVPRLRISQVSISLPLIISEVIPGTPTEARYPKDIAVEVRRELIEFIDSEERRLGELENFGNPTEDERNSVSRYRRFLNFARDDRSQFYDRFQLEFEEQLMLAFRDKVVADVGTASDAFIRHIASDVAEAVLKPIMSEAYYRYVEHRIKEEKNEKFSEDQARDSMIKIMNDERTLKLIRRVRNAAESAAIITPTKSPDFYVAVDTDSIKNSGGGPNTVTRLNMVLREEGLEWVSEKRDETEIKKLIQE